MKVSVPLMTLEDLQRLPDDGNRYELIEGELYVSAAPRDKHQRLSMDFCDWLSPFAKKHKLGRVYHAAFDVFPDPGAQTCVEPDLIFISQERLHIVRDEGVFGPPDLVIEILSESTYKTDMTTKRDLYRRTGVKEYRVAHPGNARFWFTASPSRASRGGCRSAIRSPPRCFPAS